MMKMIMRSSLHAVPVKELKEKKNMLTCIDTASSPGHQSSPGTKTNVIGFEVLQKYTN